MKKAVALIIVLILSPCTAARHPVLLEGDIIFHQSRSMQGEELELATKSRYTHMGILFKKGDDWFVYEAVQPVRVTALDQFIRRGTDGHYVIKRLRNRDEALTPNTVATMKKIARGFLGKNYDSAFRWSDERIYCSELVWKIYKRGSGIELGALQKLRDFDLTHPKVKMLMKKRYGSSVPYDETVISPVQMFNSAMLITVHSEN